MDFAQRHIGPAGADQARMLEAVGYAALDELTEAALPAGIAAGEALNLPAPLTEDEALAELRRLAGLNTVATSMIGLGYYGTPRPPSSAATCWKPRLVGLHAVPAGDLARAGSRPC